MAWFEKLRGGSSKPEKSPSSKKIKVESHSSVEEKGRLDAILSDVAKTGSFYAQVRLRRGDVFLGATPQSMDGYKEQLPKNDAMTGFFQEGNANNSIIIKIHAALGKAQSSGFSDVANKADALQLVHLANADGNGTSLISIQFKNQKEKRACTSFFVLGLHPEDASFLITNLGVNPNETLDRTLTALDTNTLQVTPHDPIKEVQSARIEIPQGKDITSVDPASITPRQ